jgi:hypothetical protein
MNNLIRQAARLAAETQTLQTTALAALDGLDPGAVRRALNGSSDPTTLARAAETEWVAGSLRQDAGKLFDSALDVMDRVIAVGPERRYPDALGAATIAIHMAAVVADLSFEARFPGDVTRA